jgi:membrane protein DedA with SNARE-associated domain
MMRFRAGLVVGAAVGYVLGTRAGKQRYEQIKRWAGEARKHPAVAQLANQTAGVVDAGRYVAATGLTTAAKGLRTIDAPSGSE